MTGHRLAMYSAHNKHSTGRPTLFSALYRDAQMQQSTRAMRLWIATAMLLVFTMAVDTGYATPFGKSGKGGNGGGSAGPRVTTFAGYNWLVESSSEAVGPGPDNFSNAANSVWVDDSGRLHLTIRRDRNRWYCSEVICQESIGHGRYESHIDSPLDSLDPNVVPGMFTWNSNAPEFTYQEIDIEIARWGSARAAQTHSTSCSHLTKLITFIAGLSHQHFSQLIASNGGRTPSGSRACQATAVPQNQQTRTFRSMGTQTPTSSLLVAKIHVPISG